MSGSASAHSLCGQCLQGLTVANSGRSHGSFWPHAATFLGSMRGPRLHHVKPQHTSIKSLEEPALVPCFDELPSPSAGFNVNDAVCVLDLWALGLGGVWLKGTWVAAGVSPEP